MCCCWHPFLCVLLQRDTLVKTCSSPTPRNFLYFSAVYSFFQKHRVPSYSFLTAWEAKASSPFFCGVKSCAKGEYLQVRKIFMELNRMTIANLSCVPYWLHTFSAQRARKKKCSVCLDSPWRHSLYVGCSLEHFNMDVCIYSTLMVELLQISRMMSDLEFIITIGVMQLITTSELSSIANCFMISILCSKCKRTACVT